MQSLSKHEALILRPFDKLRMRVQDEGQA